MRLTVRLGYHLIVLIITVIATLLAVFGIKSAKDTLKRRSSNRNAIKSTRDIIERMDDLTPEVRTEILSHLSQIK